MLTASLIRTLLPLSNDEILDCLKDHRVIEVYRVIRYHQGHPRHTDTIILTFDWPDLPESIKCGYRNFPVKMYIPNPRRCFNCQKYGHGKNQCRATQVCGNCSEEGHSAESCDGDAFCLHCETGHSVSSRTCPQWKMEKDIIHRKYTAKISFKEARRRVEEEAGQFTGSYAAAASAMPSTPPTIPQIQNIHLTLPDGTELTLNGQIKLSGNDLIINAQSQKSKTTPKSNNQTSPKQLNQSTSNRVETEMDSTSASSKRPRDAIESSSGDEDLPDIKGLPRKPSKCAGEGLKKARSGIPVKRGGSSGGSSGNTAGEQPQGASGGDPVERRRPPLNRDPERSRGRSSSPKMGKKPPFKHKSWTITGNTI